ncbi:MAG: hypothetical protein R3C03_24140 [Pirellulaceae bacterium]
MNRRPFSPGMALITAMRDPDNFVLIVHYPDDNGIATRVISPIRIEGDHVLAFCLCRGAPRRFDRKKLRILKLDRAENHEAPVPITYGTDTGISVTKP